MCSEGELFGRISLENEVIEGSARARCFTSVFVNLIIGWIIVFHNLFNILCVNSNIDSVVPLHFTGSLMLRSVRKVLFKPLEGNCRNIFEAVIPEFEDKDHKTITGESVTILFHKK